MFKENLFFQSLKDPLKTLIRLHIKDYVDTYNIDTDKLEKEYLINLGKGNTKRKNLIKKNQKSMDDPKTSEYDKQLYRYMNQILEFIVDSKNNKLAMLLLTIYFINIDNIKATIFNKFYYNSRIQQASQDFMEQMDFFAFTYFAKDKIINSLIIVLYTLLVECEKCDKKEAIKFIKMVVDTNFKNSDVPVLIRSDYLDKYPIYCAGIYNQLPIFMTYTGEQKRYYSNKDIEKIQGFFSYFLQDQTLVKFLNCLNRAQKNVSEFGENLHNKEFLYELVSNLYRHYALNPTSLVQLHCEKIREESFTMIFKHPIIATKALIKTILTKSRTKLTTRNSSRKPS